MNEHERAVFADIEDRGELTVDDELRLSLVMLDPDLKAVLEEYQRYKENVVQQLFSNTSRDFSDAIDFERRIEMAFEAVRLEHSLTERQMIRLARMCGNDLERFLAFRRR